MTTLIGRLPVAAARHPMRALSPRVAVPALLVLAAGAVFQLGPGWLGLDEAAHANWSEAWWLAVPALAAAACFLTAAHARAQQDRLAWRDIGLGCAVWVAATVAWIADPLMFPGPADVGYLASCLFVIRGMFLFCRIGSISRIQLGSFALALSAVGMALLLLLMPWVRASTLDVAGTVVACLYPVAWFGVTVFGIMCLVTDAPDARRPVLWLLVLGSLPHAVSNVFYALAMMGSSYRIGAFFDSGWVVGFLLIGWAACEQLPRGGELPQRLPAGGSPVRQAIDAFVPAAALGLVFAAGILHGLLEAGPIFAALVPPAALFTAFLGLRGHWALSMQRRLLEEARRSRKRLAFVLESTTDCVAVFDTARRMVYANGKTRAFLRLAAGPGEGGGAGGRAAPDLWEMFPEPVRRRLEACRRGDGPPEPVRFEAFFPPADAWLEFHAYAGEDRLSVFFRDITEERRMRQELEFSARHDALTGLLNRGEFQRRLVARCGGARRCDGVALLYLDLDRFKEVNDRLGHGAGDALLVQVAGRLREAVRARDTVCRLGGDEFAILLDAPAARGELDGLARRLLDALSAPFELAGERVCIGLSIGIVLGTRSDGDPDRLLQGADAALYRAKSAGRGTWRFAEPAEPAERPCPGLTGQAAAG